MREAIGSSPKNSRDFPKLGFDVDDDFTLQDTSPISVDEETGSYWILRVARDGQDLSFSGCVLDTPGCYFNEKKLLSLVLTKI